MESFTQKELIRYSRHLNLPDFSLEDQYKLKRSKVLVVGAGGLGAPLLLYLGAAGIGTLGIVDYDQVEESNLQRQILYRDLDIGHSKALAAQARIQSLNPHIQVLAHQMMLSRDNALELFEQYDIICDGTDNFATRYLVNDACVLLGKTNVYGSIFRYEGQCSVFNYTFPDGKMGPNYRDIFPEPPEPGMVPNCAEGGVFGVLPGLIGCVQANEVIKIITGNGDVLAGKLYILDTHSMQSRLFTIQKNPENPISGKNPTIDKLIDYEQFCGPIHQVASSSIPSISVETLHKWRNQGHVHTLFDVREIYEADICSIQGILKKGELLEKAISNLPIKDPIVLHCRSGQRSGMAVQELMDKFPNRTIYNLDGGILAWIERVDQSLTTY